jgi:hypothetical protein
MRMGTSRLITVTERNTPHMHGPDDTPKSTQADDATKLEEAKGSEVIAKRRRGER